MSLGIHFSNGEFLIQEVDVDFVANKELKRISVSGVFVEKVGGLRYVSGRQREPSGALVSTQRQTMTSLLCSRCCMVLHR